MPADAQAALPLPRVVRGLPRRAPPTAVVPAKPGDPAESSDRDARGCSEDQVDAVKDRIREECDGLGGWALVVCSADGIDIIMEGCGEPPELITMDRS